MEAETKTNYTWYLICFGVGVLIGIGTMDIIDRVNKVSTIITKPDTSYSKIKLDSLKVKISGHDTTIYKLNIKSKEDVEKSYQLDDSSTVALFKQLSTKSDSTK